MEKMVLYFRVSLMKQDYKSQSEDLRRWAKSNNFNIVKEFREKVSGYDMSAERIEHEKLKVIKQVNYYKDEIIKLEDIKKRYAKLFAEGYITDMEFYKDVADVKNKVRNCENKIKILEENNRDNKKSWWNYRDNIFYTDEFNIKRDFVENTIKEIKIWKVNKCVNIPWNKPLWKTERVFYLEILSYGAKEPFKVVISNINKNVFHSRKLLYFKELSCLRYK